MNKYTKMQKEFYEQDASRWTLENKNPVVGSFDAHNDWPDYDEYLFKDLQRDPAECRLLDFACGPGRNLVKYNKKFKELDGVDLAENNLKNAKVYLESTGCKPSQLFHNNGTDLSLIGSENYDVVMSTIAMQHICVYDIRRKYFEEFFRVLKPGGLLTLQMGFGKGHPYTVGYYENFYDATATNSGMDIRIDDPGQLKSDLDSIGYESFNYYIRPRGPGDCHHNWIFFNAKKPE